MTSVRTSRQSCNKALALLGKTVRLDNAHAALDAAVAAAYGWAADLGDGEVLEGLLGLNLERARAGS